MAMWSVSVFFCGLSSGPEVFNHANGADKPDVMVIGEITDPQGRIPTAHANS